MNVKDTHVYRALAENCGVCGRSLDHDSQDLRLSFTISFSFSFSLYVRFLHFFFLLPIGDLVFGGYGLRWFVGGFRYKRWVVRITGYAWKRWERGKGKMSFMCVGYLRKINTH